MPHYEVATESAGRRAVIGSACRCTRRHPSASFRYRLVTRRATEASFRRVGEPDRKPLDLHHTSQVVRNMGGYAVEADDVAVGVVARGTATSRSRAVTSNGKRTERVPDGDVFLVGIQGQERFHIASDDRGQRLVTRLDCIAYVAQCHSAPPLCAFDAGRRLGPTSSRAASRSGRFGRRFVCAATLCPSAGAPVATTALTRRGFRCRRGRKETCKCRPSSCRPSRNQGCEHDDPSGNVEGLRRSGVQGPHRVRRAASIRSRVARWARGATHGSRR